MNLLKLFEGKRTQILLSIIGLILALIQPWAVEHAPKLVPVLAWLLPLLGIGAGLTFSMKVQRLLELLGQLFGVQSAAAKAQGITIETFGTISGANVPAGFSPTSRPNPPPSTPRK